MYTVYADNGPNSKTCIFSDTDNDMSLKLISPNLNLSAGTAGSFSFTAIPGNIAYTGIAVQRLTTTIIVERDGREIWRGRPMKDKDNFANEREVTCEGALAFLNDSRVQPTMSVGSGKITISPNAELGGDPYVLIRNLLEAHNRQVPDNRKIYPGAKPSSYVTGSVKNFKPNFETTLDVINSKIVGELGGVIEVKYEPEADTPGLYLYYYSTYPTQATQTIEFGKNLIDFTRNWNTDNFVTAVLPKGAKIEQETTSETEKPEEYVSIAGRTTSLPGFVVNGPILENSTAIANFGYILGYVDYNDTETPEALLSDTEAYMQHVQFNDLELELTALDLRLLGVEESFNLLDIAMVSSYPHGFGRTSFSIIGEDIPLDRPENTRYTMGSSEMAYKRRARTLTQRNRQAQQSMQQYTDSAMESTLYDAESYTDKARAALEVRDDEIEASITGPDGELTRVKADVNGLESRVEDTEENVSSLQQTARGFETRVGNAETDISSLQQTARGFETRVSNAEGNASSAVQTANNIKFQVTDANGYYTVLNLRNGGLYIGNGAYETHLDGRNIWVDSLHGDNIYIMDSGGNTIAVLTDVGDYALKISTGTLWLPHPNYIRFEGLSSSLGQLLGLS